MYLAPATSSSKFFITDSSEEQTGMISTRAYYNGMLTAVFVNRGYLYLNSGTIKVENVKAYNENYQKVASAAVYVRTSRRFYMTGGHVVSVSNHAAYGIASLGYTTISGGTIDVTTTDDTAYALFIRENTPTGKVKTTVSGGYFNVEGNTETAIINSGMPASGIVFKGGYYNISTGLELYTAPIKECSYVVSGTEISDYAYSNGYYYTIAKSQSHKNRAIDNDGINDSGDYEVTIFRNEITIRGLQDHTPIRIYDMSGKLVKSVTAPSDEVQITVPTGVYILQIGNDFSKQFISSL